MFLASKQLKRLTRSSFLICSDLFNSSQSCQKYLNRLLICFFAVLLLWLTSLQVVTSLVDRFVQTPSWTLIYKSCEFAYDKTIEQKHDYYECSKNQLKSCSSDLLQQYNLENNRISRNSNSNKIIINHANKIYNNCNQRFMNTQIILNHWASASMTNTILYNYLRCNQSQVILTKQLLKDSSGVKMDSYTTTREYSQTSDATVGRLASYAQSLAAYNDMYVYNKTITLRHEVREIQRRISDIHVISLNHTVGMIKDSIQQLLSCLSLDTQSQATSCDLIPTADTMIVQYMELYNSMTDQLALAQTFISTMENSLTGLSAEATAAMAAADAYYEVTNDIMSYLTGAVSSLGGSVGLCGLTDPDWCSFSKVRRCLTCNDVVL